MIRLKIIVPLVSEDDQEMDQMCKDMEHYLKQYLLTDTHLQFEWLSHGFSFIESEMQGMINGAIAAMDVYQKTTSDIDGIFMNCFDDPGVYGCREIKKLPVIGPYNAAILSAMNLSERIGIISTDEAGILNEEKKARTLGVADNIVSIRSLDFSVENILEEKEELVTALEKICVDMVHENRVGAICLGCTGMFYVYEELRQRLYKRKIDAVIIEPLLNGVVTLETMVRLKYTNYIPGHIDFSKLHWY